MFCFKDFFLKFIQRERKREREAETQAEEKQASCREPDVGLDPGSPGSRPGLQAALNHCTTWAAPLWQISSLMAFSQGSHHFPRPSLFWGIVSHGRAQYMSELQKCSVLRLRAPELYVNQARSFHVLKHSMTVRSHSAQGTWDLVVGVTQETIQPGKNASPSHAGYLTHLLAAMLIIKKRKRRKEKRRRGQGDR